MKLKEFLTEEKWTKGTYARDEAGEAVAYESPLAVRFCIGGASWRLGSVEGNANRHFDAMRKLEAILDDTPYAGSIVRFNDDPKTTWADVQALLEKADV